MDLTAVAPPGPPAPPVPQDPPTSNEMINSVRGVLSSAVTVAFVTDSDTVYHTGVIIMAEDNYTVIFTRSLAENDGITKKYIEAYVLFHVAMGVGGEVRRPEPEKAHLLCYDEEFIVFFVNKGQQQPNRKEIPLGAIPSDPEPEASHYAKVFTIGAMSGTKLTLKAAGPDDKLLGCLGLYEGRVNTPVCTAWELNSLDVSEGTQRLFKFSCMYKDELVDLKNINKKEEDHTTNSILGAPVVTLDGRMAGVVYSVSTSSDDKYGVHTAAMISHIEAMCVNELGYIDQSWDFKERLRHVYQKAIS